MGIVYASFVASVLMPDFFFLGKDFQRDSLTPPHCTFNDKELSGYGVIRLYKGVITCQCVSVCAFCAVSMCYFQE